MFVMNGQTFTREQLREKVESEAKNLDAEQWLFGKFEFDEWLSDSIVTGTVTRTDEDLAM